MKEYDVAVIGAGPGGLYAAVEAADLGASVALLEKHDLGGTCLNRGCIPLKTLIHNRGKPFEEAAAARDEAIQILGGGAAHLLRLKEENLTYYANTEASFSGKDGDYYEIQAGSEPIRAKKVIIATGGSPNDPLPKSDTWTDRSKYIIPVQQATRLATLPDSAMVIGGGDAGVELAYLLASYGKGIKLVEQEERLLPNQDPDASQKVYEALESMGVKIETSARVSIIDEPIAGSLPDVFLEKTSGSPISGSTHVHQLIVAAGTTPNLQGLGLDKIGVDYQTLELDPTMQIEGAPNVYVIGDAAGAGLAHGAEYQGRAVAAGETPNLDLIVRATFAPPGVASVGKLESQLPEGSYNVRRRILGGIEYKFICDTDGKVLGATAVGKDQDKLSNTSELIHPLAALMACGGTYNDFQQALPQVDVSSILKGSIGTMEGTKAEVEFAELSMSYISGDTGGSLEIAVDPATGKINGAVVKGDSIGILYELEMARLLGATVQQLKTIPHFHPSESEAVPTVLKRVSKEL